MKLLNVKASADEGDTAERGPGRGISGLVVTRSWTTLSGGGWTPPGLFG